MPPRKWMRIVGISLFRYVLFLNVFDFPGYHSECEVGNNISVGLGLCPDNEACRYLGELATSLQGDASVFNMVQYPLETNVAARVGSGPCI
jgi:hypothetical protein